jgi:hypothetical protein
VAKQAVVSNEHTHATACSVHPLFRVAPYHRAARAPAFLPKLGPLFCCRPRSEHTFGTSTWQPRMTAPGILAKTGRSFYQEEGTARPSRPVSFKTAVTFRWLDLQEVSQSCPAGTLFWSLPLLAAYVEAAGLNN